MELRWHLNLLHNHRSTALKALLLFQGDKRVTVINIPWYLTDEECRLVASPYRTGSTFIAGMVHSPAL